MNLKIEVSLWSLLHYAAIAGFGFTLGIVGAAEVMWILWALVQAAKGLLLGDGGEERMRASTQRRSKAQRQHSGQSYLIKRKSNLYLLRIY